MAPPGERDEVVARSSQQPGMVRGALPSCFSLAAWFRLTVTLSAPLDSSCFFSYVASLAYKQTHQTGSCSSDGFSSTVENAFAYYLTNAPFNAKCYRGFIFPTGQTKVSFSCQKALSSSCSVNEFDTAADNAFITCRANVSCEAGCYRGYIFPNGRTNESYICQDGLWTPVISTCKPIPEVSVKYAVTWVFSEVVPYQCGNITAKFNDSKEILEKTFASVCTSINKTIFFTYSTLAFTITATFTAKYNNFSNWNALEKCKTLTIISFKKLSVIKTIFDNVSCGDSHLNRTILKEFRIEDSHEQCSNGMEIHNVTRSSGGTFGVYCVNNMASETSGDALPPK
uniref:Uncharacterized protein n=1 Tax=Magallana gigas TaxID=29159 RepID=K1QBY7_MAGGI